jgi:tripartite-type tricarboxylate transporter receptor subunit TctC
MRYIKLLALAFVSLFPHAALAQDYPSKPVRVVIPWPAGGPSDVLGRLVIKKLAELSRQPFVVDNRAGASGAIGAEVVSKAAADGYTLLVTGSNHVIYPGVVKATAFDPIRDFAAVGLVGAAPMVVVVHPSLPAQSFRDLLTLARTKPRELNFASSGESTLTHLVTELVNMQAKVRMTAVPYKGTAPAVADVVGGHAHLTYQTVATVLALVKENRLRALAVTTAKRAPTLPNVPTIAESGIEGFDVSNWYGLWAPQRTPPAVVQKLNAEMLKAAEDPQLRARFADLVTDVGTMNAEQFSRFCAAENQRWLAVMRDIGVHPQ